MFEPFGLSVSMRRNDPNYSFIHKFGRNFALDGTTQSIWSAGGLYPWSALSSPQNIYVISTSASDTDELEVYGLDSNFQEVTRTVSLTGTVAVLLNIQFKRIYRMIYKGNNIGTVTARVTSGTGTVVAQLEPTQSQTLMAVYTVPAGKTAYMTNYTVSTGKGDDAHVSLYVRPFGNSSFQIKSEVESYQNTFTQFFPFPLRFEACTDIDFRAYTSSANSNCILNFDMVLKTS